MKPDLHTINRAFLKNNASTNGSCKTEYKWKIVWRSVIILTYIHLACLYGLYLLFYVKYQTIIFSFVTMFMGSLGITAGVHRLWSHRTYKAKWPMRFILMIFQTMAIQDSIYQWSRDHRVHHKFVDTDADPYNARRGFFFSHIGWLLIRKHPDVIVKGATIDCNDLKQDPLVMFQKKWFKYLVISYFIISIIIPWWAWNENLWYAWYLMFCKYGLSLNFTWLVNSAAHMWGMKPYDKSFSATENIGISLLTNGEGWHNYHHAFPWDYKAGELGNYGLNFTTAFIDFFAYLGLAYDLKVASTDMIKKRILRTG